MFIHKKNCDVKAAALLGCNKLTNQSQSIKNKQDICILYKKNLYKIPESHIYDIEQRISFLNIAQDLKPITDKHSLSECYTNTEKKATYGTSVDTVIAVLDCSS